MPQHDDQEDNDHDADEDDMKDDDCDDDDGEDDDARGGCGFEERRWIQERIVKLARRPPMARWVGQIETK